MNTITPYSGRTFTARNPYIRDAHISNKAQSGSTNNNFKLMEYSKNIIRKVETARNRSDYIHGSQNIQSIPKTAKTPAKNVNP